MTKREKRLERMRENPRTVRFEDMDTLLQSLGFAKRHKGTSHAVYTHDKRIQVIPFRIPYVLPVYVKQVIAMLDEMIDSGKLDI